MQSGIGDFCDAITMGERFFGYLGCRILEAYAQGGASLRMLAQRYAVSFEYVRKIRKQQLSSGQLEHVRQRGMARSHAYRSFRAG